MAGHDPHAAEKRALTIARKAADDLQRAVSASGTLSPMLDLVMTVGVLHAYVLAFAVSSGSDIDDTLDHAEKLIRRMTPIFVDNRKLDS